MNKRYYRMSNDRKIMDDGCSRTLLRRKAGQSMVEFALILPLMVLIVAGIFDLGRAFFASITITNAAREGARFGSLWPDDLPGACNAAKNEALTSGITLDDGYINITCGGTTACTAATGVKCARHQPIIVDVGYVYNDMIFKFFFPTGINMQQQVEMLIP